MSRQDNIFFLASSIFEGKRASIYTRWFSGLTSVNIMGKTEKGGENGVGDPWVLENNEEPSPHLILTPRC